MSRVGIPVHADGVRLRGAAGSAREEDGAPSALLDASGEAVWSLNATALALWELCDGETTVEEMVGAVAVLFDADEDLVRADVDRTFTELTAAGLVRWASADTPGRRGVAAQQRSRTDLPSGPDSVTMARLDPEEGPR